MTSHSTTGAISKAATSEGSTGEERKRLAEVRIRRGEREFYTKSSHLRETWLQVVDSVVMATSSTLRFINCSSFI